MKQNTNGARNRKVYDKKCCLDRKLLEKEDIPRLRSIMMMPEEPCNDGENGFFTGEVRCALMIISLSHRKVQNVLCVCQEISLLRISQEGIVFLWERVLILIAEGKRPVKNSH